MTAHLLEVWIAVLGAFIVGSALGFILYRWIDRTDFSYDQREFAEKLATRFGRRPLDLPLLVPASGAAAPDLSAGESRRLRRILRREPASEAAGVLRDRVQTSSAAAAWKERRQTGGPSEASAPGSGVDAVWDEATAAESGVAGAAEAAAIVAAAAALETSPWEAAPFEASRQSARVSAAGSGAALLTGPGQNLPRKVDVTWQPPPGDDWAEVGSTPVKAPKPGSAALVTVSGQLSLPPPADDIWDDTDETAIPLSLEDVDLSDIDRPPGLPGPPAWPDQLRRIKGIGKGFEARLHQLGIYRFAQIATWTPAEQRWIGTALGSKGRIERDDWVGQAALFAAEGAAERREH